MSRPAKPRVNSSAQKELDQAQEKFDSFESEVKSLTLDRMNEAPKKEVEPQVELSAKEWKEAPEIYLKPTRYIDPPAHPKTGVREKFNENFRKSWEYDKEKVRFMAENLEIIGESIEIWTKPYAGIPAELWTVPVNKPVWGPRYLAEQIKRKSYHRLSMDEKKIVGSDYAGSYSGGIVVDNTIQRLDARPAPKTHISFNRKVSNF